MKQEITPVNITDRWYQEDGTWWLILREKPDYSKGHIRTKGTVRNCLQCNQPYVVLPTRLQKNGRNGQFCSRECGREAVKGGHIGKTGEKSHNWQGGIRKTGKGGYLEEYCPDHPSLKGTKRKYVRQHRLVMEKKIGRYLEPWEEVHHINAIKDDNRPENLELWIKSHPAGARYNEAVKHCPTCTCSKHLNIGG